MYTCLIFVMQCGLLFFKFIKIFLGSILLLVKSCTIVLSSSINLQARMCPSKAGSITWLWIPLRMFNPHSFVFLLRYPLTMNKHPHFLEPVVACFDFFSGTLWGPLLSHSRHYIGLTKLDFRVTIINPTLFAWRRAHSSNSSFIFPLNIVWKNLAVSTSWAWSERM